MSDWVPKIGDEPCSVLAWKYSFLTPAEEREGLIRNTAKDLQIWMQNGFEAIDFPFPKKLDIDCNTAREILTRAELVRTWNLH